MATVQYVSNNVSAELRGGGKGRIGGGGDWGSLSGTPNSLSSLTPVKGGPRAYPHRINRADASQCTARIWRSDRTYPPGMEWVRRHWIVMACDNLLVYDSKITAGEKRMVTVKTMIDSNWPMAALMSMIVDDLDG